MLVFNTDKKLNIDQEGKRKKLYYLYYLHLMCQALLDGCVNPKCLLDDLSLHILTALLLIIYVA